MCGIIGYSGKRNAPEVLISGLEALEYRGYDSAGVALFEAGELRVIKAKGKVECVKERLAEHKISSVCGIGHTRWATHGAPSDINSHPHGTKYVQIVHNGIIENYRELRAELAEDGIFPVSETDTEICALLLNRYYGHFRDPKRALLHLKNRIRGSFALGIIFKDYPNTVFAIRRDSPLIVGIGEDESLISSDVTALLPYTRRYYALPEDTLARIKGGDVSFFDGNGAKIELELSEASWSAAEAKKQGYAHYMLKEIHEQSSAIKKTLSPRIASSLPCFEHDGVDVKRISASKRIIITGCGTAYHAGLIGKYFIEKWAGIPVSVEIASELRYSALCPTSQDTVIAVSQSGETADTLSAVRRASAAGAYTVSVVNVVASGIALATDATVYTLAGPEIAVASTKAYTTQASVLCLLALEIARQCGKISDSVAQKLCFELTSSLPDALEEILASEERFSLAARRIHQRQNLFFIGRGVDYYCALEASLKLKEISYVHSEAYPAGELKHGTLSLIEDGVPVIAICTDEALLEKLQSNVREVASRGAFVIRVIPKNLKERLDTDADIDLVLPEMAEPVSPIACAAAMQLFAYYCALFRGSDIDHPRNLAKSVTVE